MAIPKEILDQLRQNDSRVLKADLSEYIESSRDIEALVEALLHNTFFKKLTIHGKPGCRPSRVNNEGAKLLSQCQNLSEIDISFNSDVTDEGIVYFAQTPLRLLQANGCGITARAFLPFFKHKFLLQLGLWNLALNAAVDDQARVGRMLKRNMVMKQTSDSIAAMLKRLPEVTVLLPKPVQIFAEKCSQDKLGDDAEVRTLVDNLSKIAVCQNAPELVQAKKIIEKYRLECEEQSRINIWRSAPAIEPTKKKAKPEPEPNPELSEEQQEFSRSPSLSRSI